MRSLLPLAFFLSVVLLGAKIAPAGDGKKTAKPKDDFEQTLNERYDPEFRQRVHTAIDKGIAWLLKTQQPDGSWASGYNATYPMGPTAFAALTLLKGGVKPTHPAVVKAFAHLRKLPMAKTYSVGVLLMALDARNAPARDPFSSEAVDKYGRSKVKDPCLSTISKEDTAWMKQGVQFLLDHRTEKGVWRYPSKQQFDLSCTQYVLLGLKAAMRCGVKIPAKVWLDALGFVLDHQKQDGEEVRYVASEVRGKYRIAWTERAKARGFSYSGRAKAATGSMTTAGLAALIICQSELWASRKFKGDLRHRVRIGIRDAMAWLQRHYNVHVNPVIGPDGKARHAPGGVIGGPNHYYYLYGLERASILGRIRLFGKHDWYEEGAEIIMLHQLEDGSWHEGPKLSHTCFAVLFLKRATSRMKVPVITPEAGGPPADPRTKRKGTGGR